MKVDGQPYRTIWLDADGRSVSVIDQALLPHVFKVVQWRTLDAVVAGIRNMVVRGAPWRSKFARADNVHVKVLDWLQKTDERILILTGS
jgi:methylthioribose-1-phosphate isomerase